MATAVASAGHPAIARHRFVATIFVGSFLLFLVQPMIGRMALPRLGGAPAVWNSAMLVYQAILLAGYAYAHWLRKLPPRRQGAVHLSLFALCAAMLPIGLIGAIPSVDANPFLWVPWLLFVSIGPLFFVVSAQAPLLQRWFVLSGGDDPYPLYAASNLGSFTGLLLYPLLLEPLLPIYAQRWIWSAGYLALMALVIWCAASLPRQAERELPPATLPRPAGRMIGTWVLLAAVPSALILSTTLYITTDIVAMPLLWVGPLAAYLLSFTIAFSSSRRMAAVFVRIAPPSLLITVGSLAFNIGALAMPFAMVNLLVVSVALHSALFDRRPHPQHLTLFYLMMSVGGVIGGIFGAIFAPMVFDWTYEHPLLLVAAALLWAGPSLFDRFVPLWKGDAVGRLLTWAGLPILLGLSLFGLPALQPLGSGVKNAAVLAIVAISIVAIGNRLLFATALAALLLSTGGWARLELSAAPGKMTRSFFGVYQIRDRDAARSLVHGTTVHGVQNLGSPEREKTPTTYYAPGSGVGLAMAAAPEMFAPRARIGLVGLGTGTLACYAQPGQSWTFYEIDPVVVAIATDRNQFTFIGRCKPDADIQVGDARLLLDREPAASADILVVDAFSSDSVPMHLLTLEAFAGYRRQLTGDGLLLVHVSNRYLDLEPVVAAAARHGWHHTVRYYSPSIQQQADLNHTASLWIALSPSRRTIDRLVELSNEDWDPLPARPGFVAWTDDHASILPLIKWSR